jgi:uncharacterized protein with NRDE domain
MCLIAFAWNVHPRWRLLLVGNRDEFHERPTAPLARWADHPGIVAGRDLQAGGTWLGVADGGRVCAVTNVRDPRDSQEGLSRGLLPVQYLIDGSASGHAEALRERAADYRPFNLLTFDGQSAYYIGNRPSARVEAIVPGVHGLSNADFNAPWPKTRAASDKLARWIDGADDGDFESLFEILAHESTWPDDVLPDTGVGIDLERQLSATFIRGERYGTRASTIVAVDHEGATIVVERRFGPNGEKAGETAVAIEASA